jgi:hypothetical protein
MDYYVEKLKIKLTDILHLPECNILTKKGDIFGNENKEKNKSYK